MHEYKTHLKNAEFIYTLNNTVLSCNQTSSGLTTTVSIDLQQPDLSVKQGRGFPYQFKMATFGCIVVIVIVVHFIVNDVRNNQIGGILGSLVAGIIALGFCGYCAVKNRKKQDFLFVKNKAGNGLRVFCTHPTDKNSFDNFVREVRNAISQAKAGTQSQAASDQSHHRSPVPFKDRDA